MDIFAKIQEMTNARMLAGFQAQMADFDGSRHHFLVLYIGTFIPCNNTIPEGLKHAINDTSLCQPEIDFLLACVDTPSTCVQDLIKIYDQTDELAECQLGGLLRQCLNTYVDVMFTS
jgi:hypothetical protein